MLAINENNGLYNVAMGRKLQHACLNIKQSFRKAHISLYLGSYISRIQLGRGGMVGSQGSLRTAGKDRNVFLNGGGGECCVRGS